MNARLGYRLWKTGRTEGGVFAEGSNGWKRWNPKPVVGFHVKF